MHIFQFRLFLFKNYSLISVDNNGINLLL